LADSRLALVLLAIAATACGAVSASSVIDDAESAAARAHSRDGDKYAVYDTTLADLYLVKAREEQGHAHYSDAEEMAEESKRHADEAVRKAALAKAAEVTVPTATIQRTPAPAPPVVTPVTPSKDTPVTPSKDTPVTPPPAKPENGPK
jgi:hypothetical protein